MTDKALNCSRLKEDILNNLESLSHRELIAKKIDLLNNIPGSGGVWYQEISLLCSLIDNKITADKLSQGVFKEWVQPIVLDLLKIGIVSAITFASGYYLAKQAPLAASQESVGTLTKPLLNTQQQVPPSTVLTPVQKP